MEVSRQTLTDEEIKRVESRLLELGYKRPEIVPITLVEHAQYDLIQRLTANKSRIEFLVGLQNFVKSLFNIDVKLKSPMEHAMGISKLVYYVKRGEIGNTEIVRRDATYKEINPNVEFATTFLMDPKAKKIFFRPGRRKNGFQNSGNSIFDI